MEAIKLAGLEPKAVLGYFEKLCTIPHGSGNTKMISDYLVSFAKEMLSAILYLFRGSEEHPDQSSRFCQAGIRRRNCLALHIELQSIVTNHAAEFAAESVGCLHTLKLDSVHHLQSPPFIRSQAKFGAS